MSAYCIFEKKENVCKCINCKQEFKNINDCSTLYAACNQDEYLKVLNGITVQNPFTFEDGPSKSRRTFNFLKALLKHLATGFHTCSREQIKQRLAICKHCNYFNGETCLHQDCGCNVNEKEKFLNKLAWADQECPIKKWQAVK